VGNTAELADRSPAGGSRSIEQPDYWWYRVRSELLQVAFAWSLGTQGRILDVGSADGPSVGWLSRHGSVVSLDLDPRGLRPPLGVCGSVPAYQWAWGEHDVANQHHRRYTRRRAVAALDAGGLRVARASSRSSPPNASRAGRYDDVTLVSPARRTWWMCRTCPRPSSGCCSG